LINKDVEFAKYCSNNRLLINTESPSNNEDNSICVQFVNEVYLNQFINKLKELKSGKYGSLFDHRTDQSSATQYFQVWNKNYFFSSLSLSLSLVLRLSIPTTKHDARLYSYIDISTSYLR
jgi:hypothetical protein